MCQGLRISDPDILSILRWEIYLTLSKDTDGDSTYRFEHSPNNTWNKEKKEHTYLASTTATQRTVSTKVAAVTPMN